MESPKISVIVPVYNVAQYLEKCVQSIVYQTYKNLEIILVDDGSTDSSGMLCDTLAEKYSRIRVIHQKNGGLSAARNTGMDNMTGEYFFFVDSDDYIHHRTIDILYHAMETLGVDIVECGYQDVVSSSGFSQINSVTMRKDTAETFISQVIAWKEHFPMTWNKLYRTKTFGKYRFAVGRLNEDEFFVNSWLPYCDYVGYVSACLYYYLKRNDSIMGKMYTIKRTDSMCAYVDRYYIIIKKFPNLKDAILTQIAYQVINKITLVTKQDNDGDYAIRNRILEIVTPIMDEMINCPKVPNNYKNLLGLSKTNLQEFYKKIRETIK